MRASLIVACVLVAACDTTDPCAAFAGKGCVALEVDGDVTVDQLLVSASGAFTLRDVPTPKAAGAATALPVFVPVLAGDASGKFTIAVRALRGGVELASGASDGSLDAGAHVPVVVTVRAGVDGGADLALPAGDLAGADLAQLHCDPRNQLPCVAPDKCLAVSASDGVCVVAGTLAAGAACNPNPDPCVRNAQCLFPGSSAGVCEQLCGTDGDCREPAVAVGGTPEPANVGYCLFDVFADMPSLKACSLPCNPVAKVGASGCPTGAACYYTGSATIAEYTFCAAAGTGVEGASCTGDGDCADGLSCIGGAVTGTRCRAVCRANTSADCAAGFTCKPGVGGNPPMFGVCCPAGGC